MTQNIYKVGGLFSGVGGIELGFSLKNKFEIKWASDIDKHSAKTYRANYNHRFIEKDINNLKGSELEDVDVLVGGFPCQAFSVAGYQKGFEDERGEVFFKLFALLMNFKINQKFCYWKTLKIFLHMTKKILLR